MVCQNLLDTELTTHPCPADIHVSSHGTVQGSAGVVSLGSVMQVIKDYGKIKNLHMKSDIEGSEYVSFGDSLARTNLCSAAENTSLVMEVHPTDLLKHKGMSGQEYMTTIFMLASQLEGCSIDYSFEDDESYLHDVPIPCGA